MSNRFKSQNAYALVAHLKAAGVDPQAAVAPAHTRWQGGCSDPGCCAQHPNTRGMLSVVTTLSNTQLHGLAVQLGLVPAK